MDGHYNEPPLEAHRVSGNLDAACASIRADRRRLERRALKEARRAARAARGWDDRPIGVETQVLLNAEAVTVTELAAATKRPGPGSSNR